MKKLESKKKLKLPIVYFITDREEIKELPVGVPFIYGDPSMEDYLVRLLEYEVLYQMALKSGYPFNFKKILLDNGYEDIRDFDHGDSLYMEFVTEGMITDDDINIEEFTPLEESVEGFKDYIRDSAVYVDIQKLKELNVFPLWLDKIEDAISTNIHNFAVFNNNMYNKKLEGMYGSLELTSPNRNLIIIDISSSIPRGVSSTCLALSKNLSETFYADVLITGSKSFLFAYENIHELDIDTIYDMGMGNEQVMFKKLVSSEVKEYQCAIVFGDNDSPSYGGWCPESKEISEEDGKKLCKWRVNKLISFHTKGTEHIAAYGRWFDTSNVEKIDGWLKYLNQ